MKKYYVLKVPDSKAMVTERVILHCLVDRIQMCSLIKRIKLHTDNKNAYFIVGGEDCSCHRVLPIIKKVLTDKNIGINLYSYDSFRSNYMDLDNLVWCSNSNCDGETITNYYTNPLFIKHMEKLTTHFMLKKELFSHSIFCKKCEDGISDAVELSSLKGIYKCSYCGGITQIKGPLLKENKPVTHLSIDEQLYLIGLEAMSHNDNTKEDGYQGEQISIALGSIPIKEIIPKPRKKRITEQLCNIKQLCDIEQLSWDFL